MQREDLYLGIVLNINETLHIFSGKMLHVRLDRGCVPYASITALVGL